MSTHNPEHTPGKYSGIRVRLIQLVIVSWLPLALIFAWTSLENRRIATSHQLEQLEHSASAASHNLSALINNAMQLTSALGHNPGLLDAQLCPDITAPLLSQYSGYANLFALSPEGELICSAIPADSGQSFQDRDYLRRALGSHRPVLGEVTQGRLTGQLVLPVAMALRDRQGQANGAVVAGVDITSYLESLVELHRPNTTLTIWDEHGTIIARMPDQLGLVGQDGSDSELFQTIRYASNKEPFFNREGLDGVARVYSSAVWQEDGRRLWITVGVARGELLGETQTTFYYSLLLLLLASLLTLSMAWWLGERWVHRPVVKLYRSARRLAAGERGLRFRLQSGANEIQNLGDALDDLSLTLERHEAEAEQAHHDLSQAKDRLEERVHARTTELQDASDNAQQQTAILARRNHEISVIREMTDLLQSCATLEEAQPIVIGTLQTLFDGSRGALYMLRESGNMLERSSVWGGVPEDLAEHFNPDACWAMRLGREHLYRYNDALHPACSHLHESVKHSCCVPLLAQGKTIGTLHFILPDDGYYAEQSVQAFIDLATELADSIGLAMANIKLRQALHDLTIRDPLTGLFNRRFVEEVFEREVARNRRHKQPLSVLMMDIDHFKRFNDTFGHEAGDVVLRACGKLLREIFRDSDLPCRLGGEEFLIILPGLPMEQAMERAEDLRQQVAALALHHDGQSLGDLTTSIGVASWPEPVDNHEELIEHADRALYRAKEGGRNRVCAVE